MQVPASFVKHLRIEAAKRDTTMKALMMEAVSLHIGVPTPAEIVSDDAEVTS